MNDWDIMQQAGYKRELRWKAARVTPGLGRWSTKVEAQHQATLRNDENQGIVRDPTAAKWRGWMSSRRRA